MIQTHRLPAKPNPEVTVTIEGAPDGVNLLDNETRLKPTQLSLASNVLPTQIGRYGTTWGTRDYGADMGANPDGSFTAVKSDFSTVLLVLANGTLYRVDPASGTKTAVSWTGTPGTFTAGTHTKFLQIKSQVFLFNGTNQTAIYDIAGDTLSASTAIADPAAPAPVKTGLVGATYTYYYKIAAMTTSGFSRASSSASITVGKLRKDWISGTDFVTLTWAAVAGASAYQIYITDQGSGYEVFLADVPGGATTSFVDDGTGTPNIYQEAPLDNTTAMPIFADMELSGNRTWGVDQNGRIYFSGTGAEQGFFSPFYGGGYIDIEKGGRERAKKVVHYRDGKGSNLATVFTTNPEGTGSTWQIDLTTISVGDTSFLVPAATKLTGSVGTTSALGVPKVGDAIHFVNQRGVFVIGPKPSILNYLATDELSVNIRPFIQSLNTTALSNICGYSYQGKVFWSVPYASTTNNRIMVFDTERRNWTPEAFTFGVKQFLEYTDTDGVNHLLAIPLTGNYLLDISPDILGFQGDAFSTVQATGRLPVDPRQRRRAMRASYAYVEINQPQGEISFEVFGNDRSKGWISLGSITIPDQVASASSGWASNHWATGSAGWAESERKSRTTTTASLVKRLRINKIITEFEHRLTTSAINAKYAAALRFELVGRYVPIRDPSSYNV